MRHLLLATALGLTGLTFAANSQAASPGPSTGRPVKEDSLFQHRSQFVINFGIQNGGDELIPLLDADTGEQVDNSRAGGFTRLTIGGDIALGDSDFSVEVTGGMLYDGLTSNLNESKSKFERKVLELIPFWNWDRHRFGIGATAHLEPSWSFKPDSQPSISTEYKDAVGAILQYDIRYDQNISVGARYTYIVYEEDVDVVTEEVDGQSFGVHVTYAF